MVEHGITARTWGENGPGMLRVVRGAALAAAAAAYHLRRRGGCHRCGRGGPAGPARSDVHPAVPAGGEQAEGHASGPLPAPR